MLYLRVRPRPLTRSIIKKRLSFCIRVGLGTFTFIFRVLDFWTLCFVLLYFVLCTLFFVLCTLFSVLGINSCYQGTKHQAQSTKYKERSTKNKAQVQNSLASISCRDRRF